MFRFLKEALLNTPEKYWVVVLGYHLHKSFFGTLLLIVGIALLFWYFWRGKQKKKYILYLALLFLGVGVILVTLSILGHIYTNNTPYFKWWDKYP